MITQLAVRSRGELRDQAESLPLLPSQVLRNWQRSAERYVPMVVKRACYRWMMLIGRSATVSRV
jgi:hypothetical protein